MLAQPLHPETCVGTCLLWNYEEVLRVLQDAGNVVATLAGHTHRVRLFWLGHGRARKHAARHSFRRSSQAHVHPQDAIRLGLRCVLNQCTLPPYMSITNVELI